jgi:hypothetical protein
MESKESFLKKRGEMQTIRGIVLVLLGLCLGFFGGLLLIEKQKRDGIGQTELRYANDPVMLYRTVGIRDCGNDVRYKGEYSGAVRLKGDDLKRAIAFLEESFGNGITDVLYVNAPEADGQHRDRGQPALLPLKKQNGIYCALGIAGSYSLPLFREFEKKYQDKIS